MSHVSQGPRGRMPSNTDLDLQQGSRRPWWILHIPSQISWPVLCSGCWGNKLRANVLWQHPASPALACVSSTLGLPATAKVGASEGGLPLLTDAHTWDLEGLNGPRAMLPIERWDRVDELSPLLSLRWKTLGGIQHDSPKVLSGIKLPTVVTSIIKDPCIGFPSFLISSHKFLHSGSLDSLP